MADSLRPEVRRIIAAVGKMEGITLPELQEVLRAALLAATGREDWTASVSTVGRERVSLTLFGGETGGPLYAGPAGR